jgi:transcriptional antiterminator NusG
VAKKIIGKSKKDKVRGNRNWYIIHTAAGYEDQVAEQIMQRVKTLSMEEKVFEALVPKEKQIEIKNGSRKVVEKKIYPGYVFVDMTVSEDSWYVVRNTPNVTGFLGFGTVPTPVPEEEISRLKKKMGVEEPKYKIDLKIGESVNIIDGPFSGFEGVIEDVDTEKGKVKVLVSMFGRETPVNLDFLQVKRS